MHYDKISLACFAALTRVALWEAALKKDKRLQWLGSWEQQSVPQTKDDLYDILRDFGQEGNCPGSYIIVGGSITERQCLILEHICQHFQLPYERAPATGEEAPAETPGTPGQIQA